MNFSFTGRQEALRGDVRSFLQEASPPSEVRRLMETAEGYDGEVWRKLAAGLGLTGLHIPTELGGSGLGYVEVVVVFEEMGRALLCAPYLSTVALGANVLLEIGADGAEGDAARAELLAAVASGELVVTVAVAEDDGRWEEQAVTTVATAARGGHVLDGHKSFVLDGLTADVIVVAARAAEGVSLFLVAADAPGLARTPLATVDRTRKQARLSFSATPARLLGGPGDGWAVLSRVLDLAAVALAAEQAGGAQRCLEMAVAHARQRVQFGRPIGTFQAIKHKCADMLVEVELARSAAYHAGWVAAHAREELAVAASLAKACCSDAYAFVAAENIQVHGGVGFTWDHDAHLYFKRARSSALLLGDATHHRERLARRLGL